MGKYRDLSRTLKPEDKKDNISLYVSMHTYIRNNFDIKNECSFCGTKDAKRTEMALLKDKDYSFNLMDYIELCVSCHKKYDMTEGQREKISIRLKNNPVENFIKASKLKKMGRDNSHAKTIIQYSMDDSFIKEWDSCADAVKSLGILASSLSNCIGGRSNSCGGFKWKLKTDNDE